ncbi:MAG: DUF4870 domain-containing protein [Nonlabens ulvanivorans]|uniref:DUF4870 domain-containing protein n=1 Tax=Nonlabens ulvanivorans TaxID=906888 RepID=UPI003263EFFF
MENTLQNNHRNLATCLHLLSFGKWLFPLGNFILPILLWMVNSKKSDFVDHHGKQVINFQLSMTLYSIALAVIAAIILVVAFASGGIEFLEGLDRMDGDEWMHGEHMGIFATMIGVGILFGGALLLIGIVDLVYTIRGAMQANDGVLFKYPLTVPFLSTKTESNNTTT